LWRDVARGGVVAGGWMRGALRFGSRINLGGAAARWPPLWTVSYGMRVVSLGSATDEVGRGFARVGGIRGYVCGRYRAVRPMSLRDEEAAAPAGTPHSPAPTAVPGKAAARLLAVGVVLKRRVRDSNPRRIGTRRSTRPATTARRGLSRGTPRTLSHSVNPPACMRRYTYGMARGSVTGHRRPSGLASR
jgi:hypothetical protein